LFKVEAFCRSNFTLILHALSNPLLLVALRQKLLVLKVIYACGCKLIMEKFCSMTVPNISTEITTHPHVLDYCGHSSRIV
jgi:hypothetical protein